jgi:uncharacterized membrane protein
MVRPGRYLKDDLEFARAVTFFDAIFAFAVTLLITTVDNFSPEAWSSLPALREANGPSLLAFAISFIVVVSFWRANHQQVTGLAALDGQVILLNCMVMFGVVLIPFATEAIGKLDLPLPVAVYAVVISGTYLMQFTAELVADRRGLKGETRFSPRQLGWNLINAAALPLVFLGSIPVAYLVSPDAAERCWVALLILMPVIGRLESSDLARHRPAAPMTDTPVPATAPTHPTTIETGPE